MVNAFRWMIFVVLGLTVVIGTIMVTSAQEVRIIIDSPLDETVDTNTITVSGGAVGAHGAAVKSVTVNGDPALGKEGILGGLSSWTSRNITLIPGPNTIIVRATDTFNNTKTENITVNYTPPPTPTPTPASTPIPTATSTSTPTLEPPETGDIHIRTNIKSASFTIHGPDTFSGSGTSWDKGDAPAGTYRISYNAVSG